MQAACLYIVNAKHETHAVFVTLSPSKGNLMGSPFPPGSYLISIPINLLFSNSLKQGAINFLFFLNCKIGNGAAQARTPALDGDLGCVSKIGESIIIQYEWMQRG